MGSRNSCTLTRNEADMSILEVTKSRTTPYYPQSDERMNRTLLDRLAMAVQNQQAFWDTHLRQVCMAYNTSVQPTYLMYGRQTRIY